jgi:hypothetical protein
MGGAWLEVLYGSNNLMEESEDAVISFASGVKASALTIFYKNPVVRNHR